jgi:hypothetical protein
MTAKGRRQLKMLTASKEEEKELAAMVFDPRLISELACCTLLHVKLRIAIVQKLPVEVC